MLYYFKNMSIKTKILLIVVLIFLIVMLVLSFTKTDKFQTKLINYITKKNYVLDMGTLYKYKDSNLEKCTENNNKDCESTAMYFNVDTYDFYMNKHIKKDGAFFEFTPLYNYINKKITYNYRSTYNNGVLMYFGTYNEDIFVCDLSYSYGVDADKKTICNYIKSEVEAFYKDAKRFIIDTYYLDYFDNIK